MINSVDDYNIFIIGKQIHGELALLSINPFAHVAQTLLTIHPERV